MNRKYETRHRNNRGGAKQPFPEERRKAALEGIHAAKASVRPSPEMAALSPEAQEEVIAAMLQVDD